MKTNQLMKSVTGLFKKTGYTLKKHSPEILIVAGVTGTVVSTVLACKATLNVPDILDETKENLEEAHKLPEDEVAKETAVIYAKTGLKIVKTYAPAVIVGGLSITGILASNNIIRKRNIALAAAYASVDKGFKEYRGRVVERFGEETDYELLHNIKKEKIEETIVDPETGKKKKVKKEVDVITGELGNPYSVIIKKGNPLYSPDCEYMQMVLNGQQNYLTDKLAIEGHVVLNEAYDALCVERTKAGIICGWTYKENNADADNYIEFKVHKCYLDNDGERELAYIVDFNCEGNIYDKL